MCATVLLPDAGRPQRTRRQQRARSHTVSAGHAFMSENTGECPAVNNCSGLAGPVAGLRICGMRVVRASLALFRHQSVAKEIARW